MFGFAQIISEKPRGQQAIKRVAGQNFPFVLNRNGIKLKYEMREGALAFACAQAWEDDEWSEQLCLAFPHFAFKKESVLA
jgi:hypothetical protein